MREVVGTNNVDSIERWTFIPTLNTLGPAAFNFNIGQMQQMDAFLVVGGDIYGKSRRARHADAAVGTRPREAADSSQ